MSEVQGKKPMSDLHRNSTSGVFNPHKMGLPYKNLMKALHLALKPKTYFEIGTSSGASLVLAECESMAVDPRFNIQFDVRSNKPALHLFEEFSDDFFAKHNPRGYFQDKRGFDFAFLDGMHHYENLLRDFMNAERYAEPGAAFLLHDCFPVAPACATRRNESRQFAYDTALPVTQQKSGWTGDVWKVVAALREFRPDLRIYCFDTPPSGLVLVTGMDPNSRVLFDKYDDIIARFMDADLTPRWFDAWHASNTLIRTDALNRNQPLVNSLVAWIRGNMALPQGKTLPAPAELVQAGVLS